MATLQRDGGITVSTDPFGILTEVLRLRQQQIENHEYGPFIVLYRPDHICMESPYWPNGRSIIQRNGTVGKDLAGPSIKERILQIGGIVNVLELPQLRDSLCLVTAKR